MNAEIIGVGTELLLGQIANTNAQKISQSLATIGVDVYRHVAVGDNLERIVEALRDAIDRSDAVIVTGGLGPTPDDITREGIAATIGVELVREEALVPVIEGVFERFGRAMPSENLRQADLPQGATAIAPEGTAPGFWLEHDGVFICALPGVPWEMEAMLAKAVLPLLRERAGDAVIVSRPVLVVGLGESGTHEKISDIVEAQSNPTIAYLASAGQVRVRLSAKANSEDEALALIRPVEEQIRERLGEAAVPGNHDSIADALGELLRDKGAMVAATESLTGGMIGSALTDAGGSGDFFKGSLVCYATESKAEVGGIDPAILDGPGPVSEEAAAAMAVAAAERFNTDLGISATGVAGPAEQDGVAVGTIFVAATFGGRTEVRKVKGYGSRGHIRSLAATAAMDLGRRMVQADGS